MSTPDERTQAMPDENLIRAEIDAYRAESRALRAETAAFRAESAAQFAEIKALIKRQNTHMDRQDESIAMLIREVMKLRDDKNGGERH